MLHYIQHDKMNVFFLSTKIVREPLYTHRKVILGDLDNPEWG